MSSPESTKDGGGTVCSGEEFDGLGAWIGGGMLGEMARVAGATYSRDVEARKEGNRRNLLRRRDLRRGTISRQRRRKVDVIVTSPVGADGVSPPVSVWKGKKGLGAGRLLGLAGCARAGACWAGPTRLGGCGLF